ncbi:GNAT family N-acetyltransferase [Protofrankia sp. BMG5.30]|uniref:GNAT family acetyltraansferase n=1 Tax=Protofrankia coriariae TaxID=1562887 RepID=A0ABR5F1X0_9ACTN|nr:GNAT family acetyltraansferase [Protofrankia coriariae]ONH35150.1 GNAT family N-acetyltransferase [Protofrankia sp. BMG5.30]
MSVTNAARQHRYEISLDGTRAGFTQYLDRGNQRIFFHTEIDEAFAGLGLAGKLISQALTDTRSTGMRVVAVCPFVARYLEKHHDFDDITDPVTPEVLAAV